MMPRRRGTRPRGSGPMDRYITPRSAARARRLRALRMAGYAGAARALFNPYVATAAAVGAAGYGIYRGVKYARRKRRQRRWLSKGGVMRDGIRIVNTLARYERFNIPQGGTTRGHNTDMNTNFLGFSGTQPTGINYTDPFNNLRTLSYASSATNQNQNIIVNDIFAHIVEGTADDQRRSCSIDIKNVSIKLRLINKNNAQILFRCMLVERIGAATENGVLPNANDWFMSDLFIHPDDPCGTLDIGDSYWTNETTSPQARIYTRLNPFKFKIWQSKVVSVGPSIASVSDTNWVTGKLYNHEKLVQLNTGPFSVQYLDTDTTYKYSKPHLFLLVWCCDNDKDYSNYLNNATIDYQYELDVKFKNLV